MFLAEVRTSGRPLRALGLGDMLCPAGCEARQATPMAEDCLGRPGLISVARSGVVLFGWHLSLAGWCRLIRPIVPWDSVEGSSASQDI